MSKLSVGLVGLALSAASIEGCYKQSEIDTAFKQCRDAEGQIKGDLNTSNLERKSIASPDGNIYKLPPIIEDREGSKCCDISHNPAMKYEFEMNEGINNNLLALRKQFRIQVPDLDEDELIGGVVRFCTSGSREAKQLSGNVDCYVNCADTRPLINYEPIKWGKANITHQEAVQCNEAFAKCTNIENWRDLANLQPAGSRDNMEKVDKDCVYDDKMPLDMVTHHWLEMMMDNMSLLHKPDDVRRLVNKCIDSSLSLTESSFKTCPSGSKIDPITARLVFAKHRIKNPNKNDYVNYWYNYSDEIGRGFVTRFIPNLHKCLVSYGIDARGRDQFTDK
ncbi:hypothetical protein IT412_03810 [Candidatus Peregrinibacteria bacterium]|nr:hypothetical protein [Candidatus Peregrinibacteria bacterium]